MTKVCKECSIEKDYSEFSKNKKSSNGCKNKCKICTAIHSKKYYKENREKLQPKQKEYYLQNKTKIANNKKEWVKNNHKRHSDLVKESYKRRRKQILKQKQEYNKQNKQKRRDYYNRRNKTDIQFRLRHRISKGILQALKGRRKSASSIKLLGCSLQELKIHLEKQFINGMVWENHGTGKNKWHIDHILPCELFNMEDERQQKICFNYNNLRPIWESVNLSKNDSLPDGRLARNLTKEEKLEYLKALGYNL